MQSLTHALHGGVLPAGPRRAPCPQSQARQVQVRAALPRQRNIVVVVDDHQRSIHALQYTLENVYRKDKNDLLTILTVVPRDASQLTGPPTWTAASAPLGSMESLDLEDEMASYATKYLQPCVELATEHGALVLTDVVHGRSVGRTVCARAESLNADLVVLAGEQHNLWHELMQGSTSQYVVAHCKQPTLVTRWAPQAAQSAATSAVASGATATA